MIKSPEQIKDQLEFWFLKYFDKTKEEFNGKEKFTLFELIEENTKDKLVTQLGLMSNEIPVFILEVSKENYVIATTERFIKLEDSKLDEINYREFSGHNGYKEVTIIRKRFRKVADVKTEGLVKEFGIRKTDGTIIYWIIPTGISGFGFWNVTKRCELVGRKYLE
jgi:glycosylphosphatidylinositol transamidase (GPIT) subunit GPI8